MKNYAVCDYVVNAKNVKNVHDEIKIDLLNSVVDSLGEMLELVIDLIKNGLVVEANIADNETGEVVFIFKNADTKPTYNATDIDL